MNNILDIANKSLTIVALIVFSLTAAINGGYERILELENERKKEILQYIYNASVKQLANFDIKSIRL